jgi:hypothetical protein
MIAAAFLLGAGFGACAFAVLLLSFRAGRRPGLPLPPMRRR